MKQTEKQIDPAEYDYVFAGASVLTIGENVLTASGVYEAETEEGKKQACVKIRVNKGDRTRVFAGDLIELEGGKKLRVAAIVPPANKGGTGKIYLKNASE